MKEKEQNIQTFVLKRHSVNQDIYIHFYCCDDLFNNYLQSQAIKLYVSIWNKYKKYVRNKKD